MKTYDEFMNERRAKGLARVEADRIRTEQRLEARAAKEAELERRKAQVVRHDALVKEIKAALRRGASAEEIKALQAKLFSV